MKQKKTLQELTLLDRFLFAEAMDLPENMQTVLEVILGKEILLKYLPQTEKEQRTSSQFRFVKMDVWAQDADDVVYDTEVQKKDTGNLPKRSRYYQSLIDSKLLEPGIMDFNALNPVVIILITPFDLFGYGRYCYTFSMRCKEVEGLELQDGALRIFLNTHGTDDENVSPELKELLHYMEHTNEADVLSHPKLRQLQKNVQTIQRNEELGVKYMQAWEEMMLMKQEGREEGRIEGREEGRIEGREEGREEGRVNFLTDLIERKLKKGFSVEEIAEFVEQPPEYVQEIVQGLEV